ncbi:hypothetical protein F383_35248 [Gossypium arboreum]|uniref:Uncharacterized protein n=1 Tax=Gossypium arboreum TaxID=29729 RepID=A0A0B0PUP4_GOSAR|nr:hypothetical protein F383_35248 [Gossypium arboreum]
MDLHVNLKSMPTS